MLQAILSSSAETVVEVGPGAAPLRARVIDPSLFTIPYCEALVTALDEAGVDVQLVGRPLRAGEMPLRTPFDPRFYRWSDTLPRRIGKTGAALKALEHCADLASLAVRGLPGGSVAHFQWLPFPMADSVGLRLCRARGPVVVTVHDTTPFNGTPTSRLQLHGFIAALGLADRLIVHTQTGLEQLVASGLDRRRIRCIPHGPLGGFGDIPPPPRSGPMTLVVFGKIRPYKGIDILIAALAALGPDERRMLRVIIAGEPMMDVAPLQARIVSDGLGGTVELRLGHLDEAAMRALFTEAEGFVFPYREIEASGVLFLVQGLGRWLIASRLGAFAETISHGETGRLVPSEDVPALTAALLECVHSRPRPVGTVPVTGWDSIARATIATYREAFLHWRGGRAASPKGLRAATAAARAELASTAPVRPTSLLRGDP
ncbi:glycosyltransferase [Pseudoroseomonas globiformis]|uniref:Glycosyltransferase n=1 Tax=Teichococcus globiformis TaxID=2307229 RepID=A0ABV7G2V4_9PROT